MILAIDPGTDQSAYVIYSDGVVLSKGLCPNAALLDNVSYWAACRDGKIDPHPALLKPEYLAIEMVASYGMPVGREVFETCVWVGRFIQAWYGPYRFVYRKEVKMHLCGSMKAKDGSIRQALLDKFGPGREKAVGTKKAPGPLYGVSNDIWSALAVAVTCIESPPIVVGLNLSAT